MTVMVCFKEAWHPVHATNKFDLKILYILTITLVIGGQGVIILKKDLETKKQDFLK